MHDLSLPLIVIFFPEKNDGANSDWLYTPTAVLSSKQFFPLHRLLAISENELVESNPKRSASLDTTITSLSPISSIPSQEAMKLTTKSRSSDSLGKVSNKPSLTKEPTRKRKFRNEKAEDVMELSGNDDSLVGIDRPRAGKKVCKNAESSTKQYIEMGTLECRQEEDSTIPNRPQNILSKESERSQEEQDHLDSALILGSLNQRLPQIHSKSLVYSPFFQCVTNVQFYLNLCRSLSTSCFELDKPSQERERVYVWNYFNWITGTLFFSPLICA